ncbi:MAG: hypothetical protein AMXMBFR58_25390 [Phycisphaerae bacterium]
MQDLGTLGGWGSWAHGVSADGSVVVGMAQGSFDRAFRWTASSGMVDLGTLGGARSHAYGVSGDGSVVVGWAYNSDQKARAFRWNGTMQDLGTLGGTHSEARAVSADGQVVVGYSTTAAGFQRAFRWQGTMQDLGTLGGVGAHAHGVSADGSVVVGDSTNSSGAVRAFRWTAASGMEDLGTLGGSRSYAEGVSADGSVVVGLSFNTKEEFHAFRWTASNGMQDIGTLGGYTSIAHAVSANTGTIVGESSDGAGATHAFRWAGVIRSVDSKDSENELHHRTHLYILSDLPGEDQSRTILRRGSKPSPNTGTADFDVVVCGNFDPAQFTLSFEATHTFDGAPAVRAIEFYPGEVPQGQWGCTLAGLGAVVNGERVATMRVFVPANAPVGEYTFRAVAEDSTGQRLQEMTFDHPVVLLFNPADQDDLVHIPGTAGFDAYIMDQFADLWIGTSKSRQPSRWALAQFDECVFLSSLELIKGLGSAARASPAAVIAHLSRKLPAHGGGSVLEGRWVECPDAMSAAECLDYLKNVAFEGGTVPGNWTGSDEIYEMYRASNWATVKYGQCWVFAGLLTSSLRSLGIPTRPVSNYESAVDHTPFDGIARVCYRLQPATGRWQPVAGMDSVWEFHVWCESWIGSQWHVADGTYGLGAIPVSKVKSGDHSGDLHTAFVIAEVDARCWEGVYNEATSECEYPDPAMDPYYDTRVGRHITTKAADSETGEDITKDYKTPETTDDPRQWSSVRVTTAADIQMGESIDGVVEITNGDGVPRDFVCYVFVLSIGQDGGRMGGLLGPVTELRTIAPHETGVVLFSVPWEDIRPWLRFSDTVQAETVVTRIGDEQKWFRPRLVRVRGLPVQITMDPADRIPLGEQTVATIRYHNPLGTPLPNSRLALSSSAGLLIGGSTRTETVLLGDLVPGASGVLERTLVGIAEGPHGLIATFSADDTVPGNDVEALTVGLCPSDFDRSGFVDTDDFTAFVLAFEAGTDDADVDGSGFVDTDDFTYFVIAFEAGC